MVDIWIQRWKSKRRSLIKLLRVNRAWKRMNWITKKSICIMKEFDQIIESQQSVEKDELDHEEVNMYYEGGCFEIGRMFDSLKAKRNDIDSGMDRLSYNTKEMIARAKWKEERAVGMKQYVKRKIKQRQKAVLIKPNGNIVGTFTTDKRLMAYIAICMRIGVVLLYIPVFIGNYTSTYKNESLDQIDTPINLRDQELNGQQLCDVFDVVKYDQIRLSGEMNGLKADMILITDKRMVINDGLIEQRDDMNKQGMMQMTVDVAKGEGICNLDNDLCEFECKVDANNVAQQTESMASYHVAQQAEFMVSLPQIKTTLLPRIETESYLSSGVELHMFCGEKYDANGPATHKGRASAIGCHYAAYVANSDGLDVEDRFDEAHEDIDPVYDLKDDKLQKIKDAEEDEEDKKEEEQFREYLVDDFNRMR
eukprot:1148595_1